MLAGTMREEQSWAELAIEAACGSAERWIRGLQTFEARPKTSDAAVVAGRYPALLSERDCVVAFARLLHEEGVPWEAIHNEVSLARWIFEAPHPAARATSESRRLRRVDLALVKVEDMLAANLPATEPGFQFDAFLEFAYFTSYWTVPGADKWGAKEKAHAKVAEDIEKIGAHLATGACRVGYVVVFEEADLGFTDDLIRETAEHNGCRLRFIRPGTVFPDP